MESISAGVSPLAGVEDLSRFLGDTSPWTVRKHIAKGNIKVVRIGRRIFVSEDEIRRIQRDGLPPLKEDVPQQTERLQSATQPGRRRRDR